MSFLKQNAHEIFLQPSRGLLYTGILFISLVALYALTKGIFKRLKEEQLAFALGISCVTVFSLFAFNNALRDFLEAGYRFRYFLGLAAALIILSLLLGYTLSKKQAVQQFCFVFMLSFLVLDSISLANKHPFYSSNKAFRQETKLSTNENIYYIIPDAMQGPESYEHFFKKPQPLAESLSKKSGFIINRPAFSNGPVTIISLAQVFNMDYILTPGEKLTPKKYHALGEIFKGNSAVYRGFHELGYTITHVADGYVSYCTQYDDHCIDKPSKLFTQDMIFLDRTQAISTVNYLRTLKNTEQFSQLRYPKGMELTEALPRLDIKPKSSQFTILHFGLPHYPYRYRADCSMYNGDAKASEGNAIEVYEQQLQCGSKKIVQLVDYIVQKDPSAIILVQSDHGSINNRQGFKPHAELTNIDLLENFNIISAYKLPERCKDYVQPGNTSPVNSFRIILGCIQNTKPKLLPHQSMLAYYLDWPNANEPVIAINQFEYSSNGAT